MAQPLCVLIAGAGIGGLAAALACCHAGCDVRLFEQAATIEGMGAGIQLGPNVTRVLQGWGLASDLKAVAAFPPNLRVRDARNGNELGSLRLGDAAQQRYGAPYATVHRADLHALLLQALSPHSNATLASGTALDEITQSAEAVSARLTDSGPVSRRVDGDVLVGADGLWSRVRQQLLDDGAPQATHHIALRALLPQKDLPQALRTQDITAWLGPNMHVVQYPVRGGEWLNVVVILEGLATEPLQGWNQRINAQVMLKVANNAHDSLQNLLQIPDNWQGWTLHQRAPMRSAHEQAQGRVALLGDAAHPMLPYLAQGAGMAIEDAAELGRCLAAQPSAAVDVSAALQHYARARWQRNARVQRRSLRNAHIFHATGLVRWGRNASIRLLGERLLDVPWLYQA